MSKLEKVKITLHAEVDYRHAESNREVLRGLLDNVGVSGTANANEIRAAVKAGIKSDPANFIDLSAADFTIEVLPHDAKF